MAATTYVFALIGVPVSTSQAIIGGILGLGFVQGFRNIRFRMLRNFGAGWLLTPLVAFILSAAGYSLV
jgi:PiT family inorganic phosphate transporter